MKLKKTKHKQVAIWIDNLTNSIVNTISGDSFPTDVIEVDFNDLKNVSKSKGWNFNWKAELKRGNTKLFKLTIVNNDKIIQGLISLEDRGDHIFVNLVENSPFNIGKNKLYEGVPGNLFAFACKMSWDNGNQGLVSFVSKTRLINHYEIKLGAVHIGNNQMIIYPFEALQLIKKYYSQLL